jgi:hypothetical protein
MASPERAKEIVCGTPRVRKREHTLARPHHWGASVSTTLTIGSSQWLYLDPFWPAFTNHYRLWPVGYEVATIGESGYSTGTMKVRGWGWVRVSGMAGTGNVTSTISWPGVSRRITGGRWVKDIWWIVHYRAFCPTGNFLGHVSAC